MWECSHHLPLKVGDYALPRHLIGRIAASLRRITTRRGRLLLLLPLLLIEGLIGLDLDLDPPVRLTPCGSIITGDRHRFPVTDGIDPVGADPLGLQIIRHGPGPRFRKLLVIPLRPR